MHPDTKTTLNIWKQRKLLLKGNITVLNHLVLVPLIYVASVVDTPKRAIQEINNATQNFIWDGNTSNFCSTNPDTIDSKWWPKALPF